MRGSLTVLAIGIGLATTLARADGKKADKIYSRGQTTWIYREAKRDKHPIGYVRLGQAVELRGEEPVNGPGCADRFYPVKPFGWVCNDRAATLDGSGRWLRAMRAAAPARTLMPFHFALSNGAPMYRRLPTPTEWAREERGFGPAGSFKPQSWGNRGHEHLAETSTIPAKHELPWFFAKGGSAGHAEPLGLVRRAIPHGSMLAYTKSFTHEGRTWLLSSDGTVVPADRVRRFRVSSFQGVDLTSSVKLPLAFFREKARPKYDKTESGFEKTGRQWAVRTWVSLDAAGDPVESAGTSYRPTLERDASGRKLWVAEDDATVIEPRDKAPIGVEDGKKWILVSITQGTLVAYEGMKPVYATLISPGAGGVPIPGKNPVKMSTTPLGVYRITFKHVASTMSPEYGEKRKFWIADVPYTQYFNAPFALHTAYWHEKFGEPMSGGCVNLSPLDGKRLFDWTESQVPAGWAGAGPGGPNGVGTYVVISR